jgi:hypothetical protein
MGYYTYFKLNVIEGGDLNIDYQEELEEMIDYYLDDSIKWYDHENDMRKFSMKYPNVVFELTGEGEEAGDLWKEYYKNGKMQQCDAVIIYPDFDESKLT